MAIEVVIDGTTHLWEPDKLKFSEAELIENTYGSSYAQWDVDLHQGYARALRVMLWILRRRTEPDLMYRDFDPSFDQVVFPVQKDTGESEEGAEVGAGPTAAAGSDSPTAEESI